MFGGSVLRCLVDAGQTVRALTRSPEKAKALCAPQVEAVVGDLGDPSSLRNVLNGVDRAFLVSPMNESIAANETTFIETAKASGVRFVAKLYGCVRHDGDALDRLHQASINALKASGIEWCLISPNTVMESNLFPLADYLRDGDEILLPCGDARMGMVACEDVARCAAVVLTSDGHHGRNYQITGPSAITFSDIAAAFSRILGRSIRYTPIPEEAFKDVLIEQAGFTPERAELEVLCHYRVFRSGGADLVTDTCLKLTGSEATDVATFVANHRTRWN